MKDEGGGEKGVGSWLGRVGQVGSKVPVPSILPEEVERTGRSLSIPLSLPGSYWRGLVGTGGRLLWWLP